MCSDNVQVVLADSSRSYTAILHVTVSEIINLLLLGSVQEEEGAKTLSKPYFKIKCYMETNNLILSVHSIARGIWLWSNVIC